MSSVVFRFQWRLGGLLGTTRRSSPTVPTPPILSTRDRASVILIASIVGALIIANVVLAVVLWPHSSSSSRGEVATLTPGQPVLLVSPTQLNFGRVEMGKKTFSSLLLRKSDSLPFKKEIEAETASWLHALFKSETMLPNHLREGIYDVLADTSNLQPGEHSTTFSIVSSGIVANVIVSIIVVPHNEPQPAHISLNPPSLNFGIVHPGNQETFLLTLGNDGGQDLHWIVDTGKPTWLTLDTSEGKIVAGTPPQIIKVSVNTTSLTPSTKYFAAIQFKSNGGNIDVETSLTISPLSETPVPINTPIVPTDTPIVPTDTPIVPTDTPIVPTDTPIVPTDTPIPVQIK